jgi:hypothetical protein
MPIAREKWNQLEGCSKTTAWMLCRLKAALTNNFDDDFCSACYKWLRRFNIPEHRKRCPALNSSK